MWESDSESFGGREYGNGVLSSTKHAVKTDGFELRGHSWYVHKLKPFCSKEYELKSCAFMVLWRSKFASEILCWVCSIRRYVTTDIPSDLLVHVGDFDFHLHKVAVSLLRCLIYCL